MNRSRNHSGLFGATGSGSRIEGVGLLGPRVLDGQGTVGALVGLNGGEVRTSYVSGGTVTADVNVGMLVGWNAGVVEDSYAVGGTVECRQVHAWSAGGFLVGGQGAGESIRRSYATGAVTGTCGSRGVLVGNTAGTVQAGYYDVEASGLDGGGGEGRTTRALKAPVASAGPYSTWSAVVWHFGTSRQYPVLRAGGHRPTAQFARQSLSGDASLGALTVSGAALSPAFAAGTTAYTVAVGHEVARVTVAATPARSVSTVAFVPAVDADPATEGRQVDLAVGANALAVEVGAEDGTTTRRYAVAVTRARAPGLDLARSLGVAEGGSGTYTVALATRPSGAVTVAVAKVTGSSANVSVSPASLTFAVSDWDGAQTVTVSAADDADTDPDAATVRHTASGGGYGAVSADLAVSVAENDAPGLVVDRTVLGVAEGGTGTYTVALATRPAGAVTVAVAPVTGGERRRQRGPALADLRRLGLGRGADGDGERGGRRRRGGGRGDGAPSRERRGLRLGLRGPVRDRHGERPHGPAPGPEGPGGGRERVGDLHGGAGLRARRRGDGGRGHGHGEQRRRGRVARFADLHRIGLERGADGDGARGGRRRCGGGRGDGAPPRERRGLRRGVGRPPGGGHGERPHGPGVERRLAGGGGRRVGDLHGGAGLRAHRGR